MDLLSSLIDAPPAQAKKTAKGLPATGFIRGARIAPPAAPPAKAGPRRVRIVDSFAGGGGASNGIALAMEQLAGLGLLPGGHPMDVDFAVNHDEAALAMHAANHPTTVHLPHNVWKVNMCDLLGDDWFGLLWLSPDCRDHSNAKGGPITSKSVRDLAWVLVRWLKELPDWQRPWSIFLENVGAFSKWSPLILQPDGTYLRDKEREGEIFARFTRAVADFGYSIGWQELVACDYGDPTIRKRLYMVMRRDGGRTDWPAPTHGNPKGDAVKAGQLEPWRVAADIIDFGQPCPSILMTKDEARAYTKATGSRIIRPLAPKTMARIAMGVKRHVLDAAEADEAFVVTCNHGGAGFRGQPLDEPFDTVARARDAHGLVVPHVAAFRGDSIGRPATEPVATVTANSFVKRPGGASPIGLVETAIVPHLTTMRNSGRPDAGADEPARTVTAGGAGLGWVEASIAPFVSRGQHGGGNRRADVPHHTVAASDGDQNQVVVPYLVPRYGERDGQAPRSIGADRPLPTPVPGGNQGSLAAVYLAQHNGGDRAPIGRDASEPLSTATQTGSQQTVVAAHMLSLKGSDRRDGSCEAPHAAICAGGQHSAVVQAAFVKRDFGNSIGQPAEEPLGSITAGGGGKADVVTLPLVTAYYSEGGQSAAADAPMLTVPTKARFGLTQADATPPPLSTEQLAGARAVAAFLRSHGCWDDREVVTLQIKGVTFVIVDIGMRMLTPRELARAQGFPDSYVLAAPYKGGVLSETEQRHKIGNSVCRRPAAAIIAANYRPPAHWFSDEALEAAE
ncbi:DNA cytosine methyltransferase [Kaistia sp. MMO-174]|uniref:DNA cytosine methyltransferase n=1 Tax=Kaistia sp. MMO-174 TaxID=3081256 RepID=UPI003019CD7E